MIEGYFKGCGFVAQSCPPLCGQAPTFPAIDDGLERQQNAIETSSNHYHRGFQTPFLL
jgi:hypothetical protein